MKIKRGFQNKRNDEKYATGIQFPFIYVFDLQQGLLLLYYYQKKLRQKELIY